MELADRRIQRKIMHDAIARAAQHEIDLDPTDFRLIDGEVTLDGMIPNEWIDALTME